MSQHAKKFENKNPIHQFFLNRYLKKILRAVKETHSSKILEIGCGEGYVLQFLRDKLPFAKVQGVDIDEEALSISKKKNPEGHFEKGDIYSFKANEVKDITLSLEVLEHLVSPTTALEKLMSQPSEYILVSVPNEPYFRLMNFLRGRHLSRWGNHPEHINLWRKNDFRTLLSKYGDVVRNYSSFPWSIFLVRRYGAYPFK